MTIVAENFEAELARRNIAHSITVEGRYELSSPDGSTLTVSLDNIHRDFERDGDLDAVSRFVDIVLEDLNFDVPSWNDARLNVRYSLEPSDYHSGFDDIIHDIINDELVRVYVVSTPDRSLVSWISSSTVTGWGITIEALRMQAEDNMSQLVENASLEIQDINGNLLGMILTEIAEFKSSLVLSSKFRALVEPTHGWPVFAVLPCRDFAYIVRCDDQEFLGRLGGVVLDEYNKSGYPITKDVLRISDDGIAAIGTFPDRK